MTSQFVFQVVSILQYYVSFLQLDFISIWMNSETNKNANTHENYYKISKFFIAWFLVRFIFL